MPALLLASSLSRLCAPHVGPAMAAAWALFAGGLPLYQRVAIEGEDLEEEEEEVRRQGTSSGGGS